MIEQALYYYFSRAMLSQAIGRILNIGLGTGHFARMLLDKRSVESVVSVEIDKDVIAAYRARFPEDDPLESNHTIIEVDMSKITDHLDKVGAFNLIYIDTIEDLQKERYQAIQDFLTVVKAKALLGEGGVILVEFQADTRFERDFRIWMETQFTKVVMREALADNAGGRAAQMIYFTLP